MTFRQKWFRETIKMMIPMVAGLSFAIVVTFAGAKPTAWTYFSWQVIFSAWTIVCTIVGYYIAKRV